MFVKCLYRLLAVAVPAAVPDSDGGGGESASWEIDRRADPPG